ncbi:hypothetical protein ES332_D05G173500v1 [Gossypium tomentosum]|uniref:Uncharacterized protein n=1 Tax=Gossypium tomentosum TaxID=34277 RepID=A0A5D2KWT8_GOSTO|nr:hypothetical protein ES332_D05G173500v1 [Gossypium tomentosum]
MCCCCCDDDCECRPLGFLLGLDCRVSLTFFLSSSFLFRLVWLVLTCICPCCLCVTIIVEFALCLIKAPVLVMKWFTSKIPC